MFEIANWVFPCKDRFWCCGERVPEIIASHTGFDSRLLRAIQGNSAGKAARSMRKDFKKIFVRFCISNISVVSGIDLKLQHKNGICPNLTAFAEFGLFEFWKRFIPIVTAKHILLCSWRWRSNRRSNRRRRRRRRRRKRRRRGRRRRKDKNHLITG